jgi:Arc/MetJ-type ribon-helix-helix transcriptional regulator
MTITLTLPEQMDEMVVERASELGYPTPDDYLLALLKADLEDDSDEEIIANLKEAWRDMKTGNVMTVEEFEKYMESPDDD